MTAKQFLHCDNFVKCHEVTAYIRDDATTHARARAKGWHIWAGKTMSDKQMTVILGPKCIGTNRSRLPPAPPLLPGDQETIQFEVIVDEAA